METKTAHDYVKDCLKIVNKEFKERERSMIGRSPEEQNIIGNLLTSTHIELDKKIKQVLDECYVPPAIPFEEATPLASGETTETNTKND